MGLEISKVFVVDLGKSQNSKICISGIARNRKHCLGIG
jgi:hypothetical protein